MVERLSVKIGDNELFFDTGKIAKQAHGAVVVTSGETVVLSAVVVESSMRPGQDFFPMTVDYREKFYAVGKIPGNFFRREARPTEREILVCRLTDRPIRPLFPKGFLNELLVCQTVFSADNLNDPDVLSINAASAALHISKVPFLGPIGAVRVGRINGEWVVNPQIPDMDDSDCDIVMAGTKEAVTMVEGSAAELTEDDMIEALEFGHMHVKEIVACIEELRNRAGVEKMAVQPVEINEALRSEVESLLVEPYKQVLSVAGKQEREDASDALTDDVQQKFLEKYGEEKYEEMAADVSSIIGSTKKALMRQQVIETKSRIDGRGLADIRPITVEVGVLPRAHGSCLFTRGETQALVVTTLGTGRDEQRLDELTGDAFSRFFLHYNFPPWSVGEVRRIMGPGRREVGHGKLAERAIEAVLPFDAAEDEENFPYTVRIVSEITESNGSSSMASVCGGIMSLMDAGVPIDAPVAGIAMGLIKDGDNVCVLTDILGAEDHLGDMDFKVCGTRDGITAFQMDVKITDVTSDIMRQALYQARDGRLHVLDKMGEALAEPRAEYSPLAPRIQVIKIDPDKIREVIGPGGKVIREIQSVTGAEIEIEDDGSVKVAAVDGESAEAAIAMIKEITAEPEVGQIYHGMITRLMGFGAFCSVIGGKEGLIHISEVSPGHVNSIEDVLAVGDEVDVKVIEIDRMGRVNLSKVQADIELGRVSEEELEEGRKAGRGGRDGGRGRGGGFGRDRDRGGRDRGRERSGRDRGGSGGRRDR